MTTIVITGGVRLPDTVPDESTGLRLVPAQEDSHLGCLVPDKRRIFESPRGINSVLEWQVRNRQGQAIDLSSILINSQNPRLGFTTPSPTGQVIFRFVDAVCSCQDIHQIIGWGSDVENGKVRVELPDEISELAGIYRFDVAITDDLGELHVIDKGLLSVERGLFVGTEPENLLGPPTIGDIRVYLRDYQGTNDLLNDVEFSADEIVSCLIRPIMQWNEEPPNVGSFDGRNFPWRHNWINATIAQLLRLAAHWYRRNNFQSSQGGITIGDRAKSLEYMQTAQQLDTEWRDFLQRKKRELNIIQAAGDVGSPYAYKPL